MHIRTPQAHHTPDELFTIWEACRRQVEDPELNDETNDQLCDLWEAVEKRILDHPSTSLAIRLRIFAHYGRRFEFNPDGDDALANMFRNIQTSAEALPAHLA